MSSRLFSRAERTLRALENAFLVLLLSLMIGLAAYQVLARNLFDSGILWGDSLVRVLVLWVTFIGAMVASRRDEHIRMDVVARFLSEDRQRLLRRFTSLFTCFVVGVFTWYSAQFVVLEYQDGLTAFGMVPAWACEVIMPVGAGVVCLRYLLHVFNPP